MSAHTATNGGVEIVYETFGSPDGQPLLLITGTAGQLLDWPEEFCELLVNHGFSVARFDNRDAGLSTHLSHAGTPSQLMMLLRPAAAAVYRLEDMAEDAVTVMDALHWTVAHLVGISQGGMIAQTIATNHPDRVCTLTSIASSPAPRIGQPRLRTLVKIIKIANPKRVKTREDAGQYVVDLNQFAGSPAYPAAEETLREHGRRGYDRGGIDMASVQRQTAAIAASGDRRPAGEPACAHPRRARRGRPDHPARSRASDRRGHPRRAPGHLPRYGTPFASGTLARDRRRDRHARRTHTSHPI